MKIPGRILFQRNPFGRFVLKIDVEGVVAGDCRYYTSGEEFESDESFMDRPMGEWFATVISGVNEGNRTFVILSTEDCPDMSAASVIQ